MLHEPVNVAPGSIESLFCAIKLDGMDRTDFIVQDIGAEYYKLFNNLKKGKHNFLPTVNTMQ